MLLNSWLSYIRRRLHQMRRPPSLFASTAQPARPHKRRKFTVRNPLEQLERRTLLSGVNSEEDFAAVASTDWGLRVCPEI